MYNSKFICTYSYYDPAFLPYHTKEKYDLEDVNDLEDMADIIYKHELLYVFGSTSIHNNSVISNNDTDYYFSHDNITNLYNIIKEDPLLQKCIERIMSVYFYQDIVVAFIVLFSYDYFFLTHRCICDYFEKGAISEENANILISAIK